MFGITGFRCNYENNRIQEPKLKLTRNTGCPMWCVQCTSSRRAESLGRDVTNSNNKRNIIQTQQCFNFVLLFELVGTKQKVSKDFCQIISFKCRFVTKNNIMQQMFRCRCLSIINIPIFCIRNM